MPPTTTTMNARSVKSKPIVWVTPPSGPKSTPLAAAMAAPMANTAVCTQRHRDAHGRGHDAVLRGGADPDPVLAVLQEEPEPADMIAGQQRGDHPVPRVLEVEEVEVPGDRLDEISGRGAPLPERVLLEHQRDAEGRQDRGERIAAQQRAQRA